MEEVKKGGKKASYQKKETIRKERVRKGSRWGKGGDGVFWGKLQEIDGEGEKTKGLLQGQAGNKTAPLYEQKQKKGVRTGSRQSDHRGKVLRGGTESGPKRIGVGNRIVEQREGIRTGDFWKGDTEEGQLVDLGEKIG